MNDIIHTAFKDNLIFTLQVDGTNYNMRKLFIIIITIIGCLSIHAREPFGDYICRYIVTYDSKTNARTYHPIYNPLKITHQGIRVKNTQQGTKIWAAKYQGPIRLISSAETERFHNFYLTNQKVEFSISDRQFVPYNGKQYYMIIFDGQVQLAEPVY